MIFFQLTIAYVLDALFGDPYWLYHPVRVIGKMISIGEKVTRRIFPKSREGQIAAGAVMAAFVVGLSFYPCAGLVFLRKAFPCACLYIRNLLDVSDSCRKMSPGGSEKGVPGALLWGYKEGQEAFILSGRQRYKKAWGGGYYPGRCGNRC